MEALCEFGRGLNVKQVWIINLILLMLACINHKVMLGLIVHQTWHRNPQGVANVFV